MVVVGAAVVVAVAAVVVAVAAVVVAVAAVVVAGAAVSELPPQADTTNRTVMNTPSRFMNPSLSLSHAGGGATLEPPGVDTRRRLAVSGRRTGCWRAYRLGRIRFQTPLSFLDLRLVPDNRIDPS